MKRMNIDTEFSFLSIGKTLSVEGSLVSTGEIADGESFGSILLPFSEDGSVRIKT